MFPTKLDLDGEEQRQNLNQHSTTPSSSQDQLQALIPNSSTTFLWVVQGNGEWGGCGQFIRGFLCPSFLFRLFSCSSISPSHEAWFPWGHIHLHQHGALHRLHHWPRHGSHCNTCSSLASPALLCYLEHISSSSFSHLIFAFFFLHIEQIISLVSFNDFIIN